MPISTRVSTTAEPRRRAVRRWAGLLAAAACALALGARAQLAEEVPFITTPDNVTLEMLRIAGVGRRDHVIDLGSGDGRIVIQAARRFGATGLGVDIDPELVRLSIRHAQAAGVAGKVRFLEQDLFATDLAPASVITMYLLPEVNMQLRPRLLQLAPGTRIVSHDWDMGDWQPDRSVVVQVPDKKIGRDKFSRVHLWLVPARVDGLWCGTGAARAAQLQVAQRHQMFTATLTSGPVSRSVAGNIRGNALQIASGGRLAVDASGQGLVVSQAIEGLPPRAGFARAAGASCTG